MKTLVLLLTAGTLSAAALNWPQFRGPNASGVADDARRDSARARDQLRLALGDKPGHDRGSLWWGSYQAEMRQREAEAVFKAKGIPLPEPDAK